MLITYDMGHGKYTSGKRSPAGEREWNFNKMYADGFVAQMSLYDVKLVCVSDTSGETDTPLSTRTNKANSLGSKFHISFHCNANTAKWGTWGGVETHVYEKCSTSSEAYRIAQKIQTALVNSSGLRNRGVKKSDLHITRETKMTAVLVENGFMDSTIDIKVLRDANKMKAIGRAIADAVANFYGLKRKGNATQPTPAPKPTQQASNDSGYTVSSTHIGVATNTAQINVYYKDNINTYKRKLQKGSWKVYYISNKMYNVGTEWIQGAEMTNLVTFKHRVLKITNKGSINCYSKPDKNYYLKKLGAGTAWKVWGFSADKKWINLGGNAWVPYNPNYMTLEG